MLVVDLLRMTSGLIYGDTTTEPGRMYEHVFEEGKERMHTPEAMTTRNVRMHWQSARCFMRPGSWQYGSSADVLGAVIEAASGKRLRGILARRNFRSPLG